MNFFNSIKQKFTPAIFFVYLTLLIIILSLKYNENIQLTFDIKHLFFIVPLLQLSLIQAPLVILSLLVGNNVLSVIFLLSIQLLAPLIVDNAKLKLSNFLCIILLIPLLFKGLVIFSSYTVLVCICLKIFEIYFQDDQFPIIEKSLNVITVLSLVGMVPLNQKLFLCAILLIVMASLALTKKIGRNNILLSLSVIAAMLTIKEGLLPFLIFINIIYINKVDEIDTSQSTLKMLAVKGLIIAFFFISFFHYASDVFLLTLLPILFIYGQKLLERKLFNLLIILLTSAFLFR